VGQRRTFFKSECDLRREHSGASNLVCDLGVTDTPRFATRKIAFSVMPKKGDADVASWKIVWEETP
jgi:hypothetical protein